MNYIKQMTEAGLNKEDLQKFSIKYIEKLNFNGIQANSINVNYMYIQDLINAEQVYGDTGSAASGTIKADDKKTLKKFQTKPAMTERKTSDSKVIETKKGIRKESSRTIKTNN